jgi:hypothetical protein
MNVRSLWTDNAKSVCLGIASAVVCVIGLIGTPFQAGIIGKIVATPVAFFQGPEAGHIAASAVTLLAFAASGIATLGASVATVVAAPKRLMAGFVAVLTFGLPAAYVTYDYLKLDVKETGSKAYLTERKEKGTAYFYNAYQAKKRESMAVNCLGMGKAVEGFASTDQYIVSNSKAVAGQAVEPDQVGVVRAGEVLLRKRPDIVEALQALCQADNKPVREAQAAILYRFMSSISTDPS